MKRLSPIGLTLAIYVLAVLVVSAGTGHLAHFGDDRLLFSTFDSKGYRALANFYSFGTEELPRAALIRLRPFVYPCFLALQRLIGTAAFQILQIILNLLTVYLLYQTMLLVTNRRWLATVCTGLLAATPTFTFIAYHALAESLGMFLCTLFLYAGCYAYLRERTGYLLIAGLALSLLVCTKPVALPFLLVFGVVTSIRLLRSQATKHAGYLVASLAAPLLVQLSVTGVLTGEPVISTAGSANFSGRFFPVVYGFAEHDRFVSHSSPEASTARSTYPTEGSQLQYVVSQPAATLRTVGYLLVNKHILAASAYVSLPRGLQQSPEPTSNLTGRFSRGLNRLFLVFHILFAALISYVYLFRRRRFGHSGPVAVLYLFVLSLLVPSVLTYWQGDRLVLLAQPVWLLTYGCLVAGLLDRRTATSNHSNNPGVAR